MSVRSFDQLVGSPDPVKLSTILAEVRNRMAGDRWGEYICNVARHVGESLGLDGTETRHRVGFFLKANGVEIGGDWFRRHTTEAERTFDIDPGAIGRCMADRAARLAVLDVLIHQLLQRGE